MGAMHIYCLKVSVAGDTATVVYAIVIKSWRIDDAVSGFAMLVPELGAHDEDIVAPQMIHAAAEVGATDYTKIERMDGPMPQR